MEHRNETQSGEWPDGNRSGLSPENLYYSDSDLGMSFISSNSEALEDDGDDVDVYDARHSLPFPAELRSMDGSRESFDSGVSRVAPWVGAEEEWLTGIDYPKAVSGDSASPIVDRASGEESDTALTELEVRMAARSVPPPPPEDVEVAPRRSRGRRALALTFVFALVAAGAALGAREWTKSSFEKTSTEQEPDRAYESKIASMENHMQQLTDSRVEEQVDVDSVESPIQAAEASMPGAKKVSKTAPLPKSADKAFDRVAQSPEPAESAPVLESISAIVSAPASGTEPMEAAAGFKKVNPYGSEPDEPPSAIESALGAASLERQRPELKAESEVQTPAASLSRAQVKTVMEGLSDEISKCNRGSSDRVIVELTVSGSTGRVGSARLADESPFNGTKEGQCVLRLVKLAKFNTFAADEVAIKYPLYFQSAR